jgi:hypothetical protein
MRVELLTRPVSIGRALNALMLLVVLFPFVPAVIRSTDTQPTFIALFMLSLALSIAMPRAGATMYHVSISYIAIGVLAAIAVYTCLLVANATQSGGTLPTRLVAFLQFCAAAVWAYATKAELDAKVLLRALLIYAVFTVIFFVTNGAIEDALIRSRVDSSRDFLSAGRGARTLAPEPSFFALQVFNIFVLSRVVRAERDFSPRQALAFLILTTFCLLASFSAYGSLLLLVVLFAAYPKIALLGALIVVSSFGVFYEYLPNWESIRAVKVILALIASQGNITELMLMDASFASRMGSFAAYLAAFREHPIVGEGFALFQGGGFIGIIAALGLLGLAFFALLFSRIVSGSHSATTKVVLIAWFIANFVSGPFGIPILGVIVGKLLLDRRDPALGKGSRRAALPAPALAK